VDNHRSLNILSLGCLYCLYKLKHVIWFFRNPSFWPLYILEMADNVWIFKILQQIKSAILRNIDGMLFIVHAIVCNALLWIRCLHMLVIFLRHYAIMWHTRFKRRQYTMAYRNRRIGRCRHRVETYRDVTNVPTFFVRMLDKLLDACIWLDDDLMTTHFKLAEHAQLIIFRPIAWKKVGTW
jgi:hypothetical protein